MSRSLVRVAQRLNERLTPLEFAAPVTHVYNPLGYAWVPHQKYLERFGAAKGRVVMMGMNPGPWGMAQTGVPFGEVNHVRDWMGIDGDVGRPEVENPKRPINGFECTRSEVSGARVWGWAKSRFGTPEAFFGMFFIINYCPLVFMEESGRNRTPDKLPAAERTPLLEACDDALRAALEALEPRMVVGIGAFAEARFMRVVEDGEIPVGRILHPSPASPVANRGWASQAEKELRALGIELPA